MRRPTGSTLPKASARLDQALVAKGLAPSRSKAHALIRAGAVTLNGDVATRPATLVGDGEIALTHDPCPWVSRGALKLLHALEHFGVAPSGTALDVGASTGGFTEVLLSRGAAEVYALDVGRDQLHPSLRADPRVQVLDGLNARDVADEVPPVDWIAADVSFISLTKALSAPLRRARPGAWLVALIKPQFELGPKEVGKGGVVRNPADWSRAVARVQDFVSTSGWEVAGVTESPITGADGNREWLLAARRTHQTE
ncbi:MAG: TlyA family RNA methyltransferase [Pseudomonadota bacterium]